MKDTNDNGQASPFDLDDLNVKTLAAFVVPQLLDTVADSRTFSITITKTVENRLELDLNVVLKSRADRLDDEIAEADEVDERVMNAAANDHRALILLLDEANALHDTVVFAIVNNFDVNEFAKRLHFRTAVNGYLHTTVSAFRSNNAQTLVEALKSEFPGNDILGLPSTLAWLTTLLEELDALDGQTEQAEQTEQPEKSNVIDFPQQQAA